MKPPRRAPTSLRCTGLLHHAAVTTSFSRARKSPCEAKPTPPSQRRPPLAHPDPRDHIDQTMESAVVTSRRISKGKSSFKLIKPHFSEDGLVTSRSKTKRPSCRRKDKSKGSKEEIFSELLLPEDVWSHIHSLLDMRDAGRAACLSRSFVRSWRFHPYLIFTDETLGCKKKKSKKSRILNDFYSRVDQILNNHSGIGVKVLKIEIPDGYTAKDSFYLNRWLQIAITPGIEELMLVMPLWAKYKFPYSLLSRNGDSIRCLQLDYCSFRPTAELGWMKNLTKLQLYNVTIKGDELERFLSASLALEWLEIRCCVHIVILKVPALLQRLRYLKVIDGGNLDVSGIDAPNLSSFHFEGSPKVLQSIGKALQIKKLYVSFPGAARYVRVELPSIMPNLESVTIFSGSEVANIPILHSKYFHLKDLRIILVAYSFPPAFDYFSLVSFLDACPSLEAFYLEASQRRMEHVSIITDPSAPRRIPEQRHHKLKTVEMTGFSSAKSLVELACHIAECATSLQFLKLEVQQSNLRCFLPAHKCNKCSPLPVEVLMEARRAHLAIMTYIEPKVPTSVKLQVVGPCSRCHTLEQ